MWIGHPDFVFVFPTNEEDRGECAVSANDNKPPSTSGATSQDTEL